MPYIKEERRRAFISGAHPQNAGELNYALTMCILSYLNNKEESYQVYNDVLGALEGAKLELYRRKIVPYENIKMSQNGDVY